jgi:uncharacterized cysteine cluster protein YcgN (CxxCxxCC family)
MRLSGSHSRSESCGGKCCISRIEPRPSNHFTYQLRQIVCYMLNKHTEKSFITSW